MTIFTWVSRGLERHKLIFMSQLCFNLMRRGDLGEDDVLDEALFSFLLQAPRKVGEENPLTWLPLAAWQSICALSELEDYGHFNANVVEAAPRFREWFNHVTPESEKLPLDWAALDRTPFKKMRCGACGPTAWPSRSPTTSVRAAQRVGLRRLRRGLQQRGDPGAVHQRLDAADAHLLHLVARRERRGDLDKLAEKQEPPLVKGDSYHSAWARARTSSPSEPWSSRTGAATGSS